MSTPSFTPIQNVGRWELGVDPCGRPLVRARAVRPALTEGERRWRDLGVAVGLPLDACDGALVTFAGRSRIFGCTRLEIAFHAEVAA